MQKPKVGAKARFKDRESTTALAFSFSNPGQTLTILKKHPICSAWLLEGEDGYRSWVLENDFWVLNDS